MIATSMERKLVMHSTILVAAMKLRWGKKLYLFKHNK